MDGELSAAPRHTFSKASAVVVVLVNVLRALTFEKFDLMLRVAVTWQKFSKVSALAIFLVP